MQKPFIQKTIPVGQLMCNCQILVCPETFETVLVDPGDEPDRILHSLSAIEKQLGHSLKVKALFHTHAHFDHIGATRQVKEHFLSASAQQKTQPLQSGDPVFAEVPQIYLHEADAFIYQNLKAMGHRFGMSFNDPLPVDQFLTDEQEFQFGKLKFSIIHTPGHSPGGVCFRMHADSAHAIPETIFTGDTLFKESVGRSDLWGGDEAVLSKSIKQRLYSLDGDTIAWPGHGEVTTVGHEKRSNPYVSI